MKTFSCLLSAIRTGSMEYHKYRELLASGNLSFTFNMVAHCCLLIHHAQRLHEESLNVFSEALSCAMHEKSSNISPGYAVVYLSEIEMHIQMMLLNDAISKIMNNMNNLYCFETCVTSFLLGRQEFLSCTGLT